MWNYQERQSILHCPPCYSVHNGIIRNSQTIVFELPWQEEMPWLLKYIEMSRDSFNGFVPR